jgi:hypothetical protein
MRSISDHLTAKFRDLGIPEISDQQLEGGRQVISFGDGSRIYVGPFSSDAEIEAAARLAFHKPEDVPMSDEPNATPLPVVEMAPAASDAAPPLAGVTARGYRPGSIKTMLAEINQAGASLMDELHAEAEKVHEAFDRVRKVKSDLKATHEGIASELGQFSNE